MLNNPTRSKFLILLKYIIENQPEGGLLLKKKRVSKKLSILPTQESKEELAYLLHIRRKGVEYSRKQESSLDKALQDILNDFHNYEMNNKVLVVLIETGYI